MREESSRAFVKLRHGEPAELQPSSVLSVEARLCSAMPTLRVERVCSRHEGDAARRSEHGAVLYGPAATKVRLFVRVLLAILVSVRLVFMC